jgi:peptide deformylase
MSILPIEQLEAEGAPAVNAVDLNGELTFKVDGVEEKAKAVVFRLVSEHHQALQDAMTEYDFGSETYEERKAFVQSMIYTMHQYGGVGLSANQVGFQRRMFVMDRIEGDKRGDTLVCYNPKVVEVLGEDVPTREGCLSFPGLSLQVKRPSKIKVQFFDEEENELVLELEGIDAKCFQHELDHMNGVRFTEKVDRQILEWEQGKRRKLIKKYTKAYGKRK